MKIARPIPKTFARSEDGSIMMVWAVSLAIFMGLLALTFDFGRLSSTQSELQAYVDNVALAAAGELDGNSDAIDRATNAAAQMISDSQTFGTGGTVLDSNDYTISFHAQVPDPADSSSLVEETDPRRARFVRIVSNGETVERGFSAAFTALTNETGIKDSVGANAVAGFTQFGCDITPLMYCMPSADFRAADHVGATIQLRAGGNGAGWGPGAFGFLDPSPKQVNSGGVCAGLKGVKLDVCLLGATGERSGCFSTNGVDIAAGQKVGNFEAALNTRFDIYQGGAAQLRNDANYAPAPQVIKGYVTPSGTSTKKFLGKIVASGNGGGVKQCLQGQIEEADTMGFPPDDCHEAGTCDRFGDGTWTAGRAEYVSRNYGGVDPHPEAKTRYEYYLAEIAAAGGAASTASIIKGRQETGRPQCSPHQSTDPGRRVAVAAGIDCVNNPVSGGATNIPVEEFAEVFLVGPMGLDGTKDFWIEIIGNGGSGDGGNSQDAVFRDVVRLYK